jgi:HD-like signal output (HDOD) protein
VKCSPASAYKGFSRLSDTYAKPLSRYVTLGLLALPTSIQRIAPFPKLGSELLTRVPTIADDGGDLRALLEPDRRLAAEVARVATKADQYKAEDVDLDLVLEKLGPSKVAEIAFTILVRDYMRRTFDVTAGLQYWRYTLACASCCAEVAPPNPRKRLTAYTAGFLHDIGRLALMASYPDRYANLLALIDRMFEADKPFDISKQETLLFGMDRFATGAWLAAAWNLPDWLRPIVGKFDKATVDKENLVEIVRAGTRIANSLGFGYIKAAPRMDIRKILGGLPAAFDHWKTLDAWQLGEEFMRAKIEAELSLYGLGSL